MDWRDIVSKTKSTIKSAGSGLGTVINMYFLTQVAGEIISDLSSSGKIDEARWLCTWKPECQAVFRALRRRVETYVEDAHWTAFAYNIDVSRRSYALAEEKRAEILRKLREGYISGAAIYAIAYNQNYAPEGVRRPKSDDIYMTIYDNEGNPIGYRGEEKGRQVQRGIPQPDKNFKLPAMKESYNIFEQTEGDRQRAWEEERADQERYEKSKWTPSESDVTSAIEDFCRPFSTDILSSYRSAQKCRHEAAAVLIYCAQVFRYMIRDLADAAYDANDLGVTALEKGDASIAVAKQIDNIGAKIEEFIVSANRPAASTAPLEGVFDGAGAYVWNKGYNIADDLSSAVSSLGSLITLGNVNIPTLSDEGRMDDACGKNPIRDSELLDCL